MVKSHTAERALWFQGRELGGSFENQAEDSIVISWDSASGPSPRSGVQGQPIVLEEGLGITGSLGCQQRIERMSSPRGGSRLSR